MVFGNEYLGDEINKDIRKWLFWKWEIMIIYGDEGVVIEMGYMENFWCGCL